jgi:DNA-binding LacI/PurR family transcriptional regulator
MFVVDIRSADSLVKSARIDYEHGMRQAVQHLAALGHQRIAFISGPEHLKTAIQRKGEFLGCMREIGLPSSRQLPITEITQWRQG